MPELTLPCRISELKECLLGQLPLDYGSEYAPQQQQAAGSPAKQQRTTAGTQTQMPTYAEAASNPSTPARAGSRLPTAPKADTGDSPAFVKKEWGLGSLQKKLILAMDRLCRLAASLPQPQQVSVDQIVTELEALYPRDGAAWKTQWAIFTSSSVPKDYSTAVLKMAQQLHGNLSLFNKVAA